MLEASTYEAAELNAGDARIKVTTEITNSGTRAGEEVVQLYINQRGTSVARPVRELKGFRRVALEPGADPETSNSRSDATSWRSGTST